MPTSPKPIGKAWVPDWPEDAPDSTFKANILLRVKINAEGTVDSVESVHCSAPDLCFLSEATIAVNKTVFARIPAIGDPWPDWQYISYQFWLPEYPRQSELVPVETMAERIYFEAPDYPRLAEQSGIEGTVWVSVLVTKRGNVRDATIRKTSGNGSLDQAALQAAKKCKFKPAMQDSKPVATWVVFPYVFEL